MYLCWEGLRKCKHASTPTIANLVSQPDECSPSCFPIWSPAGAALKKTCTSQPYPSSSRQRGPMNQPNNGQCSCVQRFSSPWLRRGLGDEGEQESPPPRQQQQPKQWPHDRPSFCFSIGSTSEGHHFLLVPSLDPTRIETLTSSLSLAILFCCCVHALGLEEDLGLVE